jgi:hypothetical protein
MAAVGVQNERLPANGDRRKTLPTVSRQGETHMRCGYDHIDPVLFSQEMQETLDIPAVHGALERGLMNRPDQRGAPGEHPDAFFAPTWCEALGWAD